MNCKKSFKKPVKRTVCALLAAGMLTGTGAAVLEAPAAHAAVSSTKSYQSFFESFLKNFKVPDNSDSGSVTPDSNVSKPAVGKIVAPYNLSATNGGNGRTKRCSVSWELDEDVKPYVKHFIVECSGGPDFSSVNVKRTTTEGYYAGFIETTPLPTLTLKGDCYFRVKAVYSYGESDWSETAYAKYPD